MPKGRIRGDQESKGFFALFGIFVFSGRFWLSIWVEEGKMAKKGSFYEIRPPRTAVTVADDKWLWRSMAALMAGSEEHFREKSRGKEVFFKQWRNKFF